MKGPLLAPHISPAKTCSGALTSVVCTSLFYLFILTIVLPKQHGSSVSWDVVGWILFLVVFVQLGDLLGSWGRCRCGVKDSSSFLPGHGGLWERIDSWLTVFTVLIVSNVMVLGGGSLLWGFCMTRDFS